jgi:SAM-dependent methyltransferase
MTTSDYSFGDTPTAADRLAVVARVFEPEMRAFLTGWCRAHPALALDLGCGPGHTTHLLAATLRARHTIGLDTSERFLNIARQGSTPAVSFLHHDVILAPFPTNPADAMFAHFLLSHLPDPAAALALWGEQLAARGLILVDEVEAIETEHPVLRRYIAKVGALVAHGGGQLAIGPALARLPGMPGIEIAADQVVELAVRTGDAATMFRMNLETWRNHPFIVEHHAPNEISELAARLDELRDADRRGEIRWKLRQMTWVKTV